MGRFLLCVCEEECQAFVSYISTALFIFLEVLELKRKGMDIVIKTMMVYVVSSADKITGLMQDKIWLFIVSQPNHLYCASNTVFK